MTKDESQPSFNDSLIYDWNNQDHKPQKREITIDDETLRDGLQSSSVRNPETKLKRAILRHMDQLGIQTADLGLPGSGAKASQEIEELIKTIIEEGMKIKPRAACRTHMTDLAAHDELMQKLGVPIFCDMFIGSSAIRRMAEGWEFEDVRRMAEEGLRFTRDHDIPTMFVTEDTTRTQPSELEQLFKLGIDLGAKRLCLTDTVGFVIPNGTRNLIRFTQDILRKNGVLGEVKLDWHGHCDRGMAMANSMAAIEAGIDQVHTTALGSGERSGNTPTELLIVNLRMEGLWDKEVSSLYNYCATVADAVGVRIAFNQPIVGADAFATATGTHAAAIVKAMEQNDEWLADRVYSSVPASEFGFQQLIRVGFMSGRHNVIWSLKKLKLTYDMEMVDLILGEAKKASEQFDLDEVKRLYMIEMARRVKDEEDRRRAEQAGDTPE